MQKTNPWRITLVVTIIIIIIGSGIYLLQRNQENKSATKNEAPSVDSVSTLNIMNLSFKLPEDWNLNKINKEQNKFLTGEVAKIEIPSSKYHIILPMAVYTTDYTIINNDILIKETSSGAKIYENICAPGKCYFLVHKNKTYDIRFFPVESDQPVPENLTGVWFPDSTLTDDDLLNFVSTIN
jgi:hypothetical protein